MNTNNNNSTMVSVGKILREVANIVESQQQSGDDNAEFQVHANEVMQVVNDSKTWGDFGRYDEFAKSAKRFDADLYTDDGVSGVELTGISGTGVSGYGNVVSQFKDLFTTNELVLDMTSVSELGDTLEDFMAVKEKLSPVQISNIAKYITDDIKKGIRAYLEDIDNDGSKFYSNTVLNKELLKKKKWVFGKEEKLHESASRLDDLLKSVGAEMKKADDDNGTMVSTNTTGADDSLTITAKISSIKNTGRTTIFYVDDVHASKSGGINITGLLFNNAPEYEKNEEYEKKFWYSERRIIAYNQNENVLKFNVGDLIKVVGTRRRSSDNLLDVRSFCKTDGFNDEINSFVEEILVGDDKFRERSNNDAKELLIKKRDEFNDKQFRTIKATITDIRPAGRCAFADVKDVCSAESDASTIKVIYFGATTATDVDVESISNLKEGDRIHVTGILFTSRSAFQTNDILRVKTCYKIIADNTITNETQPKKLDDLIKHGNVLKKLKNLKAVNEPDDDQRDPGDENDNINEKDVTNVRTFLENALGTRSEGDSVVEAISPIALHEWALPAEESDGVDMSAYAVTELRVTVADILESDRLEQFRKTAGLKVIEDVYTNVRGVSVMGVSDNMTDYLIRISENNFGGVVAGLDGINSSFDGLKNRSFSSLNDVVNFVGMCVKKMSPMMLYGYKTVNGIEVKGLNNND